MSKKNRKLHPKKQKYKNLKYQIKEVELARLEKANVPMLTQTEKQYRNHAIKFASWCREQYGCRILPEELPAIKVVFDAPADEEHLFSRDEMKNKIDLHHLRALRAQKMYRYYLDRIETETGYRAQLISEIRHIWEQDDEARKSNGYRAKRWSDMKVTGNYISRGNNRKLAKKHGLPVAYDRLALLAVSVFHLSHRRHDVTVANYLLAV